MIARNPDSPGASESVRIPAGSVLLEGDLVVPPNAKGIILFAHGSGSGRHSPRNRFVAESLNTRGLGTLLIDLLTRAEETVDDLTGHLRFDLPMLARRLGNAVDWLVQRTPESPLPIGL